jgi:hypothetical protein
MHRTGEARAFAPFGPPPISGSGSGAAGRIMSAAFEADFSGLSGCEPACTTAATYLDVLPYPDGHISNSAIESQGSD